MGILENISGPLAQQISQRGLAVVLGAGFAAFLVLAVVLNVLSQLFFKNPNEPPVVFHWFPLVGSTVTYGMDPYGFFFDCKEKVRLPWQHTGWRGLIYHSMAMSLRSFSSERRRRHIWDVKGTNSSSMGS